MPALYNRETEANETDPNERELHLALMARNKVKPGDVIGHAIDQKGTIYAFQSE